ncbi:MAG: hypothetical protein JW737_02060, partial [Acidobacteria bacterium]|nr:hypothetical protein [Acidobacteriota bacterium]
MKRKFIILILIALLAIFLLPACDEGGNSDNNTTTDDTDTDDDNIPEGLLSTENFQYLGAFRLPDGPTDIKSFQYGGHSMTFYPGGDPNGPNDGYPGSLYITGHDWEHQVAEVNIPIPVNSATKNLSELNTASFLQNFTTIMNVANLEMPRSGMAYLKKQGSQTTDKIHFCWGYHLQDEHADNTHGWCELNLANPNIKQGWYLAGHPIYIQNMSTNDYMFEIPGNWANTYVGGRKLATGRFRDGGWSGMGPAIFA